MTLLFLDERKSCKDLSSVLKVETERYDKMSNKTTYETSLYISSHKDNAEYHNKIVRGHWSIENRLNWMLDVVFNEDQSRRRTGNSAANFNIISEIALALIERVSHRKSKQQRRFKVGFDSEFREKILNLKMRMPCHYTRSSKFILLLMKNLYPHKKNLF